MSHLDFVVLLILVLSAGLGWLRGGVREIVTLAAIAAGFLALSLLGPSLGGLADASFSRLLTVVAIFAVADILVEFLGAYLVRRFVGREKKRGDRIAGSAFGAVRGWFLAAFVVFTIEVYHTDTELPPSVENSLFAPALSATANGLLRKAAVRVTELSYVPSGLTSEPTAVSET